MRDRRSSRMPPSCARAPTLSISFPAPPLDRNALLAPNASCHAPPSHADPSRRHPRPRVGRAGGAPLLPGHCELTRAPPAPPRARATGTRDKGVRGEDDYDNFPTRIPVDQTGLLRHVLPPRPAWVGPRAPPGPVSNSASGPGFHTRPALRAAGSPEVPYGASWARPPNKRRAP